MSTITFYCIKHNIKEIANNKQGPIVDEKHVAIDLNHKKVTIKVINTKITININDVRQVVI